MSHLEKKSGSPLGWTTGTECHTLALREKMLAGPRRGIEAAVSSTPSHAANRTCHVEPAPRSARCERRARRAGPGDAARRLLVGAIGRCDPRRARGDTGF